ncbi:MAG TPA: UDP-2,3-diacylglucosamine diphosphatase [Leucothrix mucor]|nr:UDP-2,3-diacylglucosamine diphosphatase [Leucothrix mucor]
MKTWFISDLHLDDTRPHITQQFFDFLNKIKDEAEALYILGDLFEAWIGDDILDTPLGASALEVVNHLKKLSDNGTKLYFAHGNRDFLIGDQFIKRIGANLLDEHQVIDLYGTPTLIMHGDTLCTDDIEYQQLRGMLRKPQWQKEFLAKPLQERIEEALKLRQISQEKTKGKQEDILDVNQSKVEKVMRKFGVTQLIHGHTHRPATHDFELDGKQAKRIVLGDWYEQSSYLEFSK